MDIVVFWFRRDLRLDDNTGLAKAIHSGLPVLPLFIFDKEIIDDLDANDSRINFIYKKINQINSELNNKGSSVLVVKDYVECAFEKLLSDFNIKAVFANTDYEPYARERDQKINQLLQSKGVKFLISKDQVIFEKSEVIKDNEEPYTVFTPYKNKWLQSFSNNHDALNISNYNNSNFYKAMFGFPSAKQLGIKKNNIEVREPKFDAMEDYSKLRDYPYIEGGTFLGPHLRFGTVSIRKVVKSALNFDHTFLSELVWREFFMQVLYHFPRVIDRNFKKKYDNLEWRNNELEFEAWCLGKTGYPIVDAGMNELNQTGYMHNRVRMITAGFLTKHLLIDWRWGEAYFAQKLLDYELSSNNGNWQWAAGTGCDAAPYFRIFNPITQQKKFDKSFVYIKKHIPKFSPEKYYKPIIEHSFARKRAINAFKAAIQ